MDALSRLLTQAFTAPRGRKPKQAASPHHYQVYTTGGDWNNVPAYMGNDREEAARVAIAVGGTVDVVQWGL